MIDYKEKMISIIVPVYNVKEYIVKCVNSLINQTYKNIEIILVDDGSTDGSSEKCEELAKEDYRIKVIHKENAGLGMARNTGMKVALGEYVSFIDSDDYVDLRLYEKMYENIQKKKPDVIYFGLNKVSSKGIEKVGSLPTTLEYKNDDVLNKFFLNSLGEFPRGNGNDFSGISACGAVYKKEMLIKNKISFKSERKILNEDVIFNLEVCKKASYVKIVPEYLYYYVFRGGSLTKSYREDRFEAARKMHYLMNEEIDGREDDYRINSFFLTNLIVCLKQELVVEEWQGKKISKNNVKKMINDPLVIEILKDYPIGKYNWKLRIWFWMIKKRKTSFVYGLTKIQIKNDIKQNG